MLILTRKVNETLCIRDDIRVTVLGVKGNQVRIGIAAPDDVNIAREELIQSGSFDGKKKAPRGSLLGMPYQQPNPAGNHDA
tara:strand:- start:45 stop:287 length:243 start_codon:yes stop_codon:yes gene_type:complete